MRWYEYKMEVDDLTAPDDLKAKLLAMTDTLTAEEKAEPMMAAPAPQTAAPAAPLNIEPKKKKPIHFPAKQLGTLARSDCGSFTHRYAHVRGFLNGVPVPVTLADVLLSTVTGVAVCGDDEVKLAFDCMRVKLGDGQYMFAGLALSDDLKVVCN